MRKSCLIAIAAIFMFGVTGIAPNPVFTAEAQASGNGQPPKTRTGKKRKPKANSKKAASSKVSSSQKGANKGKKKSRKESGKSAKSVAANAPGAPVAAPAPRQSTTKRGSSNRWSMTAVNGAQMTQARTTAMAGRGMRASLDVNKAPRSPRTRSVSKVSPAQKAANDGKKAKRTATGYVAKKAIAPSQVGEKKKVTFSASNKVLVFDNTRPVTQLLGQDRASSVLTRQPMPTRTKGRFSTFVGKVANAFTTRKQQ